MTDDASVRHLLRRLALVEERVRALVAARRAVDPAPDDPIRGLYLSDATIDATLDGRPPGRVPQRRLQQQLASIEAEADAAQAAGVALRLRSIAREFGLAPFEIEILLVALAPDLDPRYERLYGYLNDDVSQRRATLRLAFDLLGIACCDAQARHCVDTAAPLVSGGLIEVDDPQRPFLSRVLRVPDRVTAYLLGVDKTGALPTEPAIADVIVDSPTAVADGVEAMVRLVERGQLAYLQDGTAGTAQSLGAGILESLGRSPVTVDLTLLPLSIVPAEFARLVEREARFREGGILAGPIDALVPAREDAIRCLAAVRVPVVLHGTVPWEPRWSAAVPVIQQATTLRGDLHSALWSSALASSEAPDLDPVRETAAFRLSPDQIIRAAEAAGVYAALNGGVVTADLLRTGARTQNTTGLQRLARRIVPALGWDDLVLPDATIAQLRDLADRALHRTQVLTVWRMRPGGSRGAGVTALFCGDSGTGKTMSAEVVAAHLGLELYVVDLATVVDKYIGETEKNLERIFSQAAGVNAVLLFDEADALFGKRSEVHDARDRYANLEVAYLLQRMESFDGIAILTTNFRGNVDDAFTRRLDAVVEFTRPESAERRQLWHLAFGQAVPMAEDIDLDLLAQTYDMSGGEIRSAALSAAYHVAANGGPVTTGGLIRAIEREYRKFGRLVPRVVHRTRSDHDTRQGPTRTGGRIDPTEARPAAR